MNDTHTQRTVMIQRRAASVLASHWRSQWHTGVVLLVLFAASVSNAVEPTPQEIATRKAYQPAGAPSDPKVATRWNRYHDYQMATELLKKLAEAHPTHVRLTSIGKSHQGREMWLLTITNFAAGDHEQKPAFWIDGGIHANELQSVEVVLYTAWYLAEMQGRSQQISRLLDERTFYLLPMLSPDSRDAHMYQPNTTHSPRSGQVPYDDDLDGRADEDKSDDLDGDGHITQMRIRDQHGRWKAHDEYPELLVEAKEGEPGEFTLLGNEGIDNDGDGRVNEDGDGGYDPNRDWPWNWQPPSIQGGSHRYPLAAPENRAAAEFIMAHPQIAGGQSYHNAAGMILRSPGAKNDSMNDADRRVCDSLGKIGEQLLPGYRYLETATGLYEAHGTTFDWLYGMQGAIAFTNELNTPFNLFRQNEGGGFFGHNTTLSKFDKYLLLGDGFVPWREVQHPQYGKIEVGGVKKSWVRQPPSFLLEEECHRNMAFTLYHADQLPKVQVDSVTVTQLPGNLLQVDAVVVNERLIPTRTARDVEKKISPPDRITLTGEDVQVIAGFTSESPRFDELREQRRKPQEIRVSAIRQGEPVYVRWLARGQKPLNVRVSSLKGGTSERSTD